MSLPIVRSAIFRKALAVRGLHTTSGRLWWSYPGWYFEDHKSRRWPRTEEERKAAAARYGLREGDYTPVKEDYMGGVGDYPNLGDINYGVKDPYENWSYDMYRRNFSEPVDFNFNIYQPGRHTWTGTEEISGWKILAEYIMLYGGLFLLIYICAEFPIRMIAPMKPKQYPYDYNYAKYVGNPKLFPLTNYTFEAADEPEPAEHQPKSKSKGGHH